MEIPEGFANVHFVFQCAGNARQHTFALGVSPPTNSDAEVIAGEADQAFNTALLAEGNLMSPGWSYLGTRAEKTVGGAATLGEKNIVITGAGTFPPPPVNCALLIRKSTAAGGRANRGRMFVPPYMLGDNDVDLNGVIGGNTVADQQTRWTNLLDALNASELVPTLFHSDPVATPTTITSLSVQALMATQRRRMR